MRFAISDLQNISYKINNQITAPELRVIDAEGKNLGTMPREAALKLAEEQGLDLIEISSTAKPPVARLMSFDKFRYRKEKDIRKSKSARKISEFKQIRISARAAPNDLAIKSKKADEFLREGHRVEIMLVLRGREKANKAWASRKLEEFIKMIKTEHRFSIEPRFGGRGMIAQIIKR